MLEELRDPLGIQGILLPAGQGLDVLRVDHEDLLEVALQDVEDGLPVDPRALHGHVGAPRGHQPVEEREELSRGGPEGPQLLRHVAAAPQPPQAGRDAILVHIQAAADGVQNLHGAPPPTGQRGGASTEVRIYEACYPARGRNSPRCQGSAPVTLNTGSRHQSKADLHCRAAPSEYSHAGRNFHPSW